MIMWRAVGLAPWGKEPSSPFSRSFEMRGVEFHPSTLHKGVRSERFLKLTVADMYVSPKRLTKLF